MTTSTTTSRRPVRQPAAGVGTPGTSRSSGRRTAQGRRTRGAREVDALLTRAMDAVSVTAEALRTPQALTGGQTRIYQTIVESVVEAVEGCDLKIAVAEYIDWYNHRRLHGQIGLVPPAEYDNPYYQHNPASTTVEASEPSLH